ncbi:MAG: hypothetical protein H7Z41_09685 [Cytophagales bacterium]|nr:hypothetical protein [Armatimonadota bacterium]
MTSTGSTKERFEEGNGNVEGTIPTLFTSDSVRVSEIVGDLNSLSPSLNTTAASTLAAPHQKRQGLGFRLDWYDLGVIVLVAASALVAVSCLLSGG